LASFPPEVAGEKHFFHTKTPRISLAVVIGSFLHYFAALPLKSTRPGVIFDVEPGAAEWQS
jgi:hypothetical protein